jgi:hypothetical protein
MPWPLIRCALASRANLAVVPMQDLLALDDAHRMNIPGVAEGNWNWRFQWDQIGDELPGRLTHLVKLFGRAEVLSLSLSLRCPRWLVGAKCPRMSQSSVTTRLSSEGRAPRAKDLNGAITLYGGPRRSAHLK